MPRLRTLRAGRAGWTPTISGVSGIRCGRRTDEPQRTSDLDVLSWRRLDCIHDVTSHTHDDMRAVTWLCCQADINHKYV